MPIDQAREFAKGHVLFWHHALVLQHGRATSNPDASIEAEVDAQLFAVALRNVIRAVKACRPWAENEIDEALDVFDDEVPRAVDIRDVLEHFDEYERGDGKLQRKQRDAGRAPFTVVRWTEETPGHLRYRIAEGLMLNVTPAFEAGSTLAGAALHALTDW